MIPQQMRRGLALAVGLGFGFGLMAGAAVMAMRTEPRLTDAQVEARARTMGMVRLTEMPQPTPAPPQQPAPAPTRTLALALPPGTDVTTLAETLKASGAIADTQAFLQRVEERGAAGRLQAGAYEISLPATSDQIIDALAGKD